jgi:hypothetical protein
MANKEGGHHKKYGKKMANPRITKSKERRQCGSIGYATRVADNAKKNHTSGYYTTRAAAISHICMCVIKPHPQSRSVLVRSYSRREPQYSY